MNRKTLIAFCGTCGVVLAVPHSTGLLHEDLELVAPERQVHCIPVAPGAAGYQDMPRVDLSDELPPVGAQGSQNSCGSWAMAYYHRTQLEFRERGWDLTDPNHQFSPAFVYNQTNGGGNLGNYPRQIGELICAQGCASMADCRYGGGWLTWPSETAYARALPFRCRDWAWLWTRDTVELGMLKQLLCNGSTVPLGIWFWYPHLWLISDYDNIYCVADRNGSNAGGHMVTIVGYDDTMTTRDGPGAFRVVNSWGPSWGDSGFAWISYQAVMDVAMSFRQAWYLVDTVGYEPELLARVQLDHPTRDHVSLKFSVGPRNWPLWEKELRTWIVWREDQQFPDNKLVFDLTEAADLVETGQPVYFECQDLRADGQSGTLVSSSVQYLPWCNIFSSTDVPAVVADDGSPARAGHRLKRYDRDVGVSHIMSPPRVLKADSSYQPQAVVWNCGTAPASFPVRLAIGTEYADTLQVSSLGSSDTTLVSFREWTAPGSGDRLVRCSTMMAGDEYRHNDASELLARVYLIDVAVIEIVAPPDTVDSGVGVRPQVRIRNNGTQEASPTALFRIPDEDYQCPKPMPIPADSERVDSFATWTPRLLGWHTLNCTLYLSGDMNDSNNILTDSVFVRRPGPLDAVSGAEREQAKPPPTALRWTLGLRGDQPAALLDITGRRIAVLRPGKNDIRQVAPGVYFVRQEGPRGPGSQGPSVRKVVIQK